MSSNNIKLIAGIDEVGRGCLAGPVLTAAVILDQQQPIEGLQDSKKLTPQQRLTLAEIIQQQALCWSIGRAEASEIDQINILQATMLAMARAYHALSIKPDWVRVDGNRYPDIPSAGEFIIGGDDIHAEISAASIIAKVARDQEMIIADVIYPGYGFAAHKGYPTTKHRAALLELGPTVIHRHSFAPVRNCLI
ncbi:MAG: ribonuclease HII [Methylococcales bacterium]